MLGLHFKMLSSLILLLYKVLELNQGQDRLGNVSFQLVRLSFYCCIADPGCLFFFFFLGEDMEVTLFCCIQIYLLFLALKAVAGRVGEGTSVKPGDRAPCGLEGSRDVVR